MISSTTLQATVPEVSEARGAAVTWGVNTDFEYHEEPRVKESLISKRKVGSHADAKA